MDADREGTLWDALNPVALFRCRPAEFCGSTPSICPGIFWLPGLVGLVALPVAGIWGCWLLWPAAGPWAVLSLAPAGLAWGWLAAADMAFRLRSPTREERAGFDNAVVNWFGLVATLVFWPSALLAGVASLVWWLVG